MIRYIKTFEVIFSTNNLSGMHISTMWHSLNVLKYFCPLSVYIYMFICSELIEETGRPPGLILGMCGYFWPGSDKFESWKKLHTFDGVMT